MVAVLSAAPSIVGDVAPAIDVAAFTVKKEDYCRGLKMALIEIVDCLLFYH